MMLVASDVQALHFPFPFKHKLRLDYRVDGARADGRDVYDGEDDLTDWTDDQVRELACDMLSIDHGRAHRIEVVRE